MAEAPAVRFLRIAREINLVLRCEGGEGCILDACLDCCWSIDKQGDAQNAARALFHKGEATSTFWKEFLRILRKEGLDVDAFLSKLRGRYEEVNHEPLPQGDYTPSCVTLASSWMMDWIASQLQ